MGGEVYVLKLVQGEQWNSNAKINYTFSAEYGGVLAITFVQTSFLTTNAKLTVDGFDIINSNSANLGNLYPFITLSNSGGFLGMQIPFAESIYIRQPLNNTNAIDHSYWLYKYVLVE